MKEKFKIRTIVFVEGKVFNPLYGYKDAVIVTVDGVETNSFTSECDAQCYAAGLRDAFAISGYKVIFENRIPIDVNV